ncbi:hypothetical protein BASA83_011784 [Batrachochytrium salamandrivorans]|nr:hypothetical protein BASA83_011784 [Batrachochytrium salamandrivorans]
MDAHFQQLNGSAPIPGITIIDAYLFASMKIVHPCSPHTQRCTDMHWSVMTKETSSPLRFIPLAVHKLTRDINCEITNGVKFHNYASGHARRGLPIENREWPGLFVLEQELQAKPLSIDQHLAAVDAKIEALNLAKSK